MGRAVRCGMLAVVVLAAATAEVPVAAAATVPGRPRIVSVSTSAEHATLRWDAPTNNGGSPITGFVLSGDANEAYGASARTANLDLPEDGATYHLTLAARNAHGVGAATGIDVVPRPNGYWMLEQSGNLYAFGEEHILSYAYHFTVGKRYVHVEPSRSGRSFLTVTDDGQVAAFTSFPPPAGSDAVKSYGSLAPGTLLPGERIVSLSRMDEKQAVCNCTTKEYESYWLFTSRGRVLPFGHAKSYGDMSNVALNQPIVGSVSTPTGRGYYMVAADGGIFAFGDARFHGSTGNLRLNAPVMGLVPNAGNSGYWLVASDGGIFAFNAPFRGSMGGTPLNRPVAGMVRFGDGYLMVGSDGGIFDFSNKAFYGSLGDHPSPTPIVSVAASG